MPPPSINTQVVITDDNKWLDVWDAAGGNQQVSLTEQTYDDIPAVCAALQVLLQALGGTWAAATVTVVFDGAVPGMIRIHSNQGAQATTIRWLNGPHGSGFLDNHCGDVLGYDEAADDNGAFFYTSDWQHRHGWYATRAIRKYGPLLTNTVGGELRKTLSRRYAKKVTIGHEAQFDFAVEQILPEEMLFYLATGANTNRAMDYVLDQMQAGEWFRFRWDQEVLGSYFDFYLEDPSAKRYGNVVRAYDDFECYNFRAIFNYKVP
jgi:hypothetical protein